MSCCSFIKTQQQTSNIVTCKLDLSFSFFDSLCWNSLLGLYPEKRRIWRRLSLYNDHQIPKFNVRYGFRLLMTMFLNLIKACFKALFLEEYIYIYIYIYYIYIYYIYIYNEIKGPWHLLFKFFQIIKLKRSFSWCDFSQVKVALE